MTSRIPSKQALTLTNMAASRIKDLMASRLSKTVQVAKNYNYLDSPIYGVKVGVRRRGCNGYSYVMNYCEDKDEVGMLDEVVEDKEVRVIVDSKALMFIIGMEMDYVDNEIKSEFVFNNPNAKGTCGCGESFHV